MLLNQNASQKQIERDKMQFRRTDQFINAVSCLGSLLNRKPFGPGTGLDRQNPDVFNICILISVTVLLR
jgi:hypothetical protein